MASTLLRLLYCGQAGVLQHGLGMLYSEDAIARGVTTELADLTAASVPLRLQAASGGRLGCRGCRRRWSECPWP